IRRVVIVGGGSAGWMAASILAKAFGPSIKIELVESEEIGIVGVGEATIPQIRLLTGLLGIDEQDFLRRTQGTIKLGIEFDGWSEPGSSYMHAFGTLGRSLGMLTFHHYWLRAGERGGSLWDYSLNYQAAKANRFAPLERQPDTGLEGLVHAFHFDATLVAQYLRRYSEAAGVRRTEGRIVDAVLREPKGYIESVRLADGRSVSGDLFIDCSGFQGILIERALASGYEDWRHWLPCDRAVAVPCASVEPLQPYTRAIARKAGWQWRIPLQHRIGNGYVYCSEFLSDDEAIEVLMSNLDGEAQSEPRQLRFTTGMRKRFWNRNCVALGLASGFMEPLESTSIHLVQSGLSRLINLFPDRRFDPALIDEYNRQTRSEFERIRDFLILHYHANGRTDGESWRGRRALKIPPELERKIAVFRGSGRLLRHADELFTEVAWLQLMVGQGILPTAHHALADRLTMSQLDGFLSDLRKLIGRSVESLPTHRAYLEQHCRADFPQR
ncbi:MAG: tryptophan halogenase family protein, partial [Woeseiaceae bacterium]